MNKILVVNNDPDTMSLLKLWLEKRNYQVKFTSSREEVQVLVQTFQPTLIIADILQQQVIDDLRMNLFTKYLPILLMTGYTKNQETQWNRTFDVDDIIEKPFNFAMLEYKVERLMHNTEILPR
jgi:DNA-binding response OmpR family regulator